MLRIVAVLFGIASIFTGVAGFLPSMYVNGLLFNAFEMHALLSIVYIVAGVVAIMAASTQARLFFKVFGLIYTIAAIVGFWRAGDLFLTHVNTADNILHIVLGVMALLLGFVRK